jgi:hypothetical protein
MITDDWNNLPHEIINSNNLNAFKNSLALKLTLYSILAECLCPRPPALSNPTLRPHGIQAITRVMAYAVML